MGFASVLLVGATFQSDPPLKTHHFNIQIGGVDAGAFKSVEGISIEVEIIEYHGADNVIHKSPGRAKYGDITLKRAYNIGSTLNDWIEQARLDPVALDSREVSIQRLDKDGNGIQGWTLHSCFPVKWESPPFDTGGRKVAFESLTLACDSWEEN
jgi:phage tail-like protein